MPVCKVLSAPGFCFFHLVLLFWNQIFTCVSVKLRDRARFSLSHTDRYRVARNLFSRATSCSYVKAVLARRGLAHAWSTRRRLCGDGSCEVATVLLPASSFSLEVQVKMGSGRTPGCLDSSSPVSSPVKRKRFSAVALSRGQCSNAAPGKKLYIFIGPLCCNYQR